MTISTPIYAGFRPTKTLESLPITFHCLPFTFQSVRKKMLRSAIVGCPAIDEQEIEGNTGEERWCSIVPHFKSIRVLAMHKPGTAEVKTLKEELDERFPLPKRARTCSTSSTINHSGHSRLHGCQQASHHTLSWQHLPRPPGSSAQTEYSGLVHLPRYPSPPLPTLCLPFHDLFLKKIDRNVVPSPPPPRKVVPLTEQRFMKADQCFGLNESDDDDDLLFFKPSSMNESSSVQRCHEQVEVNFKVLERW